MTTTGELVAGRELDALVAEKVMGWLNVFEDRDPEGEMHFWVGVTPDQHWLDHIPKFSTEIEAAWEVVEQLQPDHGPLTLLGGYRNNEWSACFGHQLFQGADAAPLAICRAALAAIQTSD